MTPLQILLAEHRAIEQAAADILAMLSAAELDHVYAKLRTTLAGLVADHLLSEQRHLFERLAASDRAAIPRYAEVCEAIRALRLDYSGHVCRWTTAAIRAEPDVYRQEVRAIVARLIAHIRVEERDLYGPAFRLIDGPRFLRPAGLRPAQAQPGAALPRG